MRRKTSPAPLVTSPRIARPLRPVRNRALLPTAAALAIALAGCSAPSVDVITNDPSTKPKPAVSAPPAPSPSASAPLMPDPHDLDGDVVYVKPTSK